ncbi:SDR family oxidoreductase [Streptomyces sp. NPDC088354]|uniref:SDR family oxidoreductase n=1 Tax=unclassified Streptomyces TaxID=2593676 RepID=UPI0029B59554|nr:3-beta hydroxysteroid dehydrogenase [Streptomyces sp. MI02-7b]MDX3072887.1 3-beta hydroxysteroid dehydrogenase [Streptomyces sp. MI02-7b]
MRIAVAGGTGWVGRMVVESVRAAGNVPVVLARSAGVDLTTGAGLDAALQGCAAVIDVSNVTTTGARKSVAFFEAATTRLLTAGTRAGVGHHVALSIVGCDRVDFGYYMGKRRQEELVLSGPVPNTVLRATQFHEFAAQMLARRGPVMAPRMRSQPIAAREVAEALVRLVGAAPAGLVPDLAGPEVLEMDDMVRRLARARGERRFIVPVRLPGATGRALAGGALLPAVGGSRGRLRFAEWVMTGDAGVRGH